MGCKCTRDLFYGESEIIRAQAINPKNSRKINEKPLSKSKFLSYQKNSEYIKIPEVELVPKTNEETASINNMNRTQNSFCNYSVKEEPLIPKDIYAQKVISLINNIRTDPISYANVIEESIKNIRRTKNNKIIYYDKIKIALFRGEEAFLEAAEKLRNIQSLPALEFNPNLCIPLPDTEEELKEQNFLNIQVENMRQKNFNVEVYYRDLVKIPEVSVLLMIVDDNSKKIAKKRTTLLNKNFKYIGVNSKFIGKNFIAHFSFSR